MISDDFMHSAALELKSMSTVEIIPALFHGLNTIEFGSSQNNPFFAIKKIAMDPEKSWDDRTQAVRYMQKIPHIHRDSQSIEATLSIIDTIKFDIKQRYYFFSNNDAIIKLNYEIVNASHLHVYNNFDKLSENQILLYKILSAQYLLTRFPIGTYDSDGVQTFLFDLANDENQSIEYRANCADILDRQGYGEYKKKGRMIIENMGSLYQQNRTKTIYTNSQNVHDHTITESVIETLRHIIGTTKTTRSIQEIHDFITNYSYEEKPISEPLLCSDSRQSVVLNSFQRIVIDTSIYEGITLSDILLFVWEIIQTHEHKKELENRLIEELFEMDKTCSTGVLSRILNTLSGFVNTNISKISYTDQLRTNVFARYASMIVKLPKFNYETIITEMTAEEKPTIEEFIITYSCRDELFDEFVPKYVNETDFNKTFQKSENDFFGINN